MSISAISQGQHAHPYYRPDDDSSPDNSSRFGGDSSPDKPAQDRNKPASDASQQVTPAQRASGTSTPGAGGSGTTTDSSTRSPTGTVRGNGKPPGRASGGAAATGGPVLPGATTEELQKLSDRYDSDPAAGRGQSRNLNADDAMKEKLDTARQLDYTGYPPDVAHFGSELGDAQARLAALPPERRQYYAGQLATYETVYRNLTSPEARAALEKLVMDVESKVLQEYNRAVSDPQDRALAVFNHPLGEGYLDAQRGKQLGQLDDLRKQFLSAPNAASREAIFQRAAGMKKDLQQAAAAGADAYLKKDRAAWADANSYVDRLIDDAGKIQDPLKRYKAISDGLFSFNTGMGEDDVADRRVLAFTQHMRDDDDLQQKLDSWQVEAGRQLNKDDAGAPTPYTDMLKKPPAAGSDYIRDLADQYTNVGKKTTDGEREAAFNRAKPYMQVIEGVARFLLGLTPLAPLTSAFDAHSFLSPQARLGIDIAAQAISVALDPVLGEATGGAKDASFMLKLGKDAAEADQPEKEMALASLAPHVEMKEGEGRAVGDAGGGAGTLDRPAAASQGGGASGVPNVPDTYASQPGGALTPDPEFRGIYRDDRGQGYIRQGDSTYAVNYDRDNGTWQVQSPDGGTKPPYPVRLDRDGNWEVNPDTGLKGGSGRFPSHRYTEEDGKKAYEDYTVHRRTMKQIADDLHIDQTNAMVWARKYAAEHGLPDIPKYGNTLAQTYTDALGQQVYENHANLGLTNDQIAEKLGISTSTVARRYTRYVKEHGLESQVNRPVPVNAGVPMAGRDVYEDLRNGLSLKDSASTRTGGDTARAYRAAMNYVETRLDTHGDPAVKAEAVRLIRDAQARRLGLDTAAAADTPASSRMVLMELQYPMTSGQYQAIRDLYDEGVTPAQIAQRTGVPEASVNAVAQGDGYYSDSHQAYMQPISADDTSPANLGEPAAKRPRTDTSSPNPPSSEPGPSGYQPGNASPPSGTAQPQTPAEPPATSPSQSPAPVTPPPAPSPAQPEIAWTRDNVPQWGRTELNKMLSPEHAGELDPHVRRAILDWLKGNAPAPESLLMELYEQGFFDLTPDVIRKYFQQDLRPSLTDAQTMEVGEWLDSRD